MVIRHKCKADSMQTKDVSTFSLNDNVWQGIMLSDSAVQQIIKLMQQKPQAKGLKLGVKQSGCAGFAYVLDLSYYPADNDLLFELGGAKLYVPLKAMPFLDGTTVDFVCEGLNQMFKFNNPKAQLSCGCGESFSI